MTSSLPEEAPREGGMLGRVIAGKYVLQSVIGDGSCGVVYRAKQLALGKDVAIKILHRAMSLDGAIVERFHREARAASQLDHPSSIAVFDFGQEPDGLLYLVMEYVAGRDLLTVMNDEGPLETRRIAVILGQILAALAVAHDRGIVHRDLKPENILIVSTTSDDGEPTDLVKVCDFGIAAIASSDDPDSMRLTARGLVVGTPEYMAPEQALGESIDGRADLYALGAVLYQLLTHRVPFRAESPVATVLEQIKSTVVPPSRHVPAVDPTLEQICLRALAKDRAERFDNARQMRAALRELLRARRSELPAPAPAVDRRFAMFAGAAGVVGLIVAAAISGIGPRPAPIERAAAANAGKAIELTAVTDSHEGMVTVESRPIVPAALPLPVELPPPPVAKPRATTTKKPAPTPATSATEKTHVIDDGF